MADRTDTYKKYEVNNDAGDENTTTTPTPDTGNNTSTSTIPMADRQSPQEPARDSESDTITGNESATKERVERTYTDQSSVKEESADTDTDTSAQDGDEPEVRTV